MESLTKRRVSTDEPAAMVRRGFGDRAEVASWSEVAEGSYNAVYLLTLARPDEEVVLKVAPDPGLRLLTYEVDLMRTEIEFYRRAGAVGVPVPEVMFADLGRRLLETDYVFLSRIPGVPLNTVREQMSETELTALRAEVAGTTAGLHAVTGSGFGYPLRASRTWKSTWREAFGLMIDDILADAVRLEGRPLEIHVSLRSFGWVDGGPGTLIDTYRWRWSARRWWPPWRGLCGACARRRPSGEKRH